MQIANVFIPGTVISILLGLFCCFFGYKIKKLTFFIIWFIMGYYVGTLIPTDWMAESSQLTPLVPFVVAFAFSMLGLSAEKICISLIASAFAFLAIMNMQGGQFTTTTITIAAVCSLIAGYIAGALVKPIFIVLTSLVGAYFVATSILSIESLNLTFIPFFYIIFVTLGICGYIYQTKTNKGKF